MHQKNFQHYSRLVDGSHVPHDIADRFFRMSRNRIFGSQNANFGQKNHNYTWLFLKSARHYQELLLGPPDGNLKNSGNGCVRLPQGHLDKNIRLVFSY